METFLLLIREDLQRIGQDEELHFELIREMDEWVKQLSKKGQYLSGDALTLDGRYVTRDRVLSDGPFIEAKESVSGFIFLEAKDLQHAISIAQSCPHVLSGNMAIEVRPVMGLTDVRELGDAKRTTSNR